MEVEHALKKAIMVEKEAMKRYMEYAKATKNVSGKNMFLTLALDEWNHMSILEKQLDSISGRNIWYSAEISKSEIELLVPKLKETRTKSNQESGLTDIEALSTALREERKANEYYLKQAGLMTDPGAKKMYLRLAEMEEAHYQILEAELDGIKGTGFWLGIPEFTMD
ncbi:MAG: ferritin family protein [Nitrospirae bacterium]|nr:ferritin family protein [Nitrospirota bacterium]MBI5097316.1 ferritin family protein [Nitrospirota bacterium]